ncbi:uncharacterized protein LAESUDRAFT_641586 [Laetiporus sulphureus 93-53]|uniref:CxC1-like cysteine cluster associated with KDZ transposases domain-containing protein n=1 Tax=Laetiporus sulphureus 93-53 TaxID=1314785 RepID=A0A165HRR6_9APHY|nr:uncharacterized protein LAESUDRAFT_641586 [Laetiporus sulphureus 93-53]KZT12096.1 hypothetical protein LAESUDRAFT_641586 [Laetiporus sulphureus 93-53]
MPSENPSSHDFTIDTLDIYTLATSATIRRRAEDVSASEALAHSRYLGTSPVNPSLAISFSTLELFRCIRLFKPSFSVEAFAKLVSYYYKIPFRRHYRTAIANAFDIYLSILREVRKRINTTLGQDTPNWHVLNACPACTYELDEEPPLEWRRIFAMDGNNSLKRIAEVSNRARGDMRSFATSDYFLSRDFVDRYANEVKSRPRSKKVDTRSGQPGDPTDGEDGNVTTAPCATNWKAAASEDHKHMWAIFDEAGIFVAACRHGLMLWVTDMVQSGELAKYPLAILAKALEVFGIRLLVPYNIGCVFQETTARSSLGPDWLQSGSRCCVNTFHGYTHNYTCQMQNHLNIIKGMGLEDGETLKRLFSASNSLALVTWYASPYRRHVLIDLFFQQWDDEKYGNLSLMLYNNCVQALKIINEDSIALADTMQALTVSREDLDKWSLEERHYFKTLGQEHPWDVHAVAYIEKLQEWRAMRAQVENVHAQFVSSIPSDYTFILPSTSTVDYYAEASCTQKLETKWRYSEECERMLLHDVATMEVKMGITRRWQPTDREYMETVKYIVERRYHRALEHLQRLVIQRLFELHKLNLAQTAYHARTHIAKSLQTRCKAICNAVKTYNAAALTLDPPRPTLDWSKVSHYSFLDEFALLQDTQNDIRQKPWATPIARECMKKARRLDRAHEEVMRVGIEARRLQTSIVDEEILFSRALTSLDEQMSPLYGAVQEFCERRRHINARHLAHLQQLSELEGFVTDLSPGQRKGSTASSTDSGAHITPTMLTCTNLVGIEDDELLAAQDDEVNGDLGELVDYLSELSVKE